MTENKRFILDDEVILDNNSVADDGGRNLYWVVEYVQRQKLVDLLNELHEEKEDWKNNCLKSVNENSILWNEISILREQGAEPSGAFKNYLNNLKNKNNKLQGDLE